MPSFVKSICLGLALLAAGPTHTVACYAFGDNDLLNLGSTPFLAQSTLQYGFDGGSQGGLGLRTSINLTGNQTGTNAATYGTSPQLGNQLSGFSTTGSVSGPLGTPVSQSFDGMGQVGTRQPDGTTDTMTWDALGRLMSVSRRNSGNGFNWSAIYDGLGRRQQTSQQNVTGGTPTGSPLVIQSSYDPNVEFLELGVTVSQSGSNVRDWLVHGPDLNGVYGGLHGTGGVEAVYNGTSHVTTGIVSDLYGHTEATVANNVTTTWNAVHSDGYGPFPGSSNTPVPINASQDVSTVLAWRGKYVDGTGYYYLGTRYYAPDSGTFLSCDPAGHAASMDLYSYCNGDPVNGYDPDGRFASNYANNTGATSNNSSVGNALNSVGSLLYNILPNSTDITNIENSAPKAWNEISSLFSSPVDTLTQHVDSVPNNILGGLQSLDYASSTPQGRSNITLGALTLAVPVLDTESFASMSGRFSTSLNFETTNGFEALEGYANPIAPQATPTGNFYSVAYEMKLTPTDFGRSDSVHFNRANAALDAAIKADPEFAVHMENMIPGVSDSVSSVGGRATPEGWVWHHSTEPGVMQLVPEAQHTPGSIFWDTFHPNGMGGYAIWARPAGAPPR